MSGLLGDLTGSLDCQHPSFGTRMGRTSGWACVCVGRGAWAGSKYFDVSDPKLTESKGNRSDLIAHLTYHNTTTTQPPPFPPSLLKSALTAWNGICGLDERPANRP